jgi:uncharacterized protein with NRDE domain
MCLVVFSFEPPTDHKFVLFANRDEFYERQASPMQWWKDNHEILAGKDISSGGTWLGIGKDGRFGAITNYKEPVNKEKNIVSRGLLIKEYLENPRFNALAYFDQIDGNSYSGFSLILGDKSGVHYFSNRSSAVTSLISGTHALSNILLNSEESKANSVKKDFNKSKESIKDHSGYIEFMFHDKGNIEEENSSYLTPSIGEIPYRFITSKSYGTRCTTVLTISKNGLYEVSEMRFKARGEKCGKSIFSFYPE